MNPVTDPIYAGIAGAEMDPEEFALGHGLMLRKTYAHFMAPFLMAFAPAVRGQPHPAPWSAVSGGLAVDIHLELFVPQEFELPRFFDRLNTVWWIAALLRLRGAAEVHVPVLTDRHFRDIPQSWKDVQMLPIEVLPRRQLHEAPIKRLADEDLAWLRDTWFSGGLLMGSSAVFNDALQAFDGVGGMPSPTAAMIAVWGVLEQLFSPGRELRFRLAANIASYLEPPGEERLSLRRKITKLYDARSSVAHGTKLESAEAWTESMNLARRALLAMLARGSVPSKEELEAALFAPASERQP